MNKSLKPLPFFLLHCAAVIGFSLLVMPALAQNEEGADESEKTEKVSMFKDTSDGALDISRWLTQVYGAVPVVTVITEPAFDYGVAGSVLVLHQSIEKAMAEKRSPPSITGALGFYTGNESWGVGAFHRGYYKEDAIRTRFAYLYSSINFSIYRDLPDLGEVEFKPGLAGHLFVTNVAFRIMQSRHYVGGVYLYYNNKVSFDIADKLPPEIEVPEFDTQLSGLGLVYYFDTRDNIFTPNTGFYVDGRFMSYPEWLGSSIPYQRLDAFALWFKQVSKVTIGLRMDVRTAFNDPPFYSLPFVQMRGIPSFRYQGDFVTVLETEERWDIKDRWALVGFAGMAGTFSKRDDKALNSFSYAVGGGFRYLFSKLFNIYGGIDVGRGPEDWAFYITFGHYWNTL